METLSREDSEEEVPAAFFEASLFLFEIFHASDSIGGRLASAANQTINVLDSATALFVLNCCSQ